MRRVFLALALAGCTCNGALAISEDTPSDGTAENGAPKCSDGSFPIVREIPLDFICMGVAWDGEHFWLSASAQGGEPCEFYILDEKGHVLSHFPQGAGASGWGHRNLCYSDGYVWGSFCMAVDAFEPGLLMNPPPPDYAYVGQFWGCLNPNRPLANACEPFCFYTGSFGGPLFHMEWDGVWGSTAICSPYTYPFGEIRGIAYDQDEDCLWMTSGDGSGDLYKYACNFLPLGTYTTLPEYDSHGDCAIADIQPFGKVLAILMQSSPNMLVLYGIASSDVSDGSGEFNGTKLLPPQPNPFVKTTSLEYHLSQPGQLNIGIYDVSGRLVRRLLSTAADIGHGTVGWDGRDEGGIQVKPGAYLCRLAVGSRVRVQRLITLE